MKLKVGTTSFGYINVESKFLTDRIWSIYTDWKSLIRNEKSSKAIALSMTINRTTGGKGMANLLHKRGHEISHTEICHLNKSWANKVAINTNRVLSASLSTARPTHVFIDNSDRK